MSSHISKAAFSLILATGLNVSGAFAQTAADNLKAAEKYYNKGDHYSAALYYEKYLTGSGTKTTGYAPYVVQHVSKKTAAAPMDRKQVIYKLAESYRHIKYYEKAEPYYKEAMSIGTEYPLAAYWYAKCLKANTKQAEAEVAFNDFVATYPTQDGYMKDAKHELENIQFARRELLKKDLQRFKVEPLATGSDHGANYALTGSYDGSLVFTSTRPDSMMVPGKGNPYTNKLMKAEANTAALAAPQMMQLPAADVPWEQGVASFTPDGKAMFLTRWNNVDGKRVAAIYSASLADGKWSVPTKVSTVVNADGANSQQPFVTADGKQLVFSSNRPGGSGGYDLWSVDLDAGHEPIGDAINLGSTINTEGDEESPYFHQPSNTLVYATNGKVGMGGLDLFYAKKNGAAWDQPKNMGYPVNSVKDDSYYYSTNAKNIWNNAYLSSDRSSPCCLQLFSFERMKVMKHITGKVVDCDGRNAVSGASIVVTDANGNSVTTKTTDANGAYEVVIEDHMPLKFSASGAGYDGSSLNYAMPEDPETEVVTNPDLCLTKPPVKEEPKVDEVIVLENVMYDFDRATLRQESYPALDKLVALMQANPNMTVELGAHTDNIGSAAYNMALSERRAKACVDYIVSKGIDASRLVSKGYGETMPLVPNTKKNGKDDPEGRMKNRRTEFKVLSK